MFASVFFGDAISTTNNLPRFSLLPENLETADVVNLAYARTLQKHHTFLQRQVQLKNGNNWARWDEDDEVFGKVRGILKIF